MRTALELIEQAVLNSPRGLQQYTAGQLGISAGCYCFAVEQRRNGQADDRQHGTIVVPHNWQLPPDEYKPDSSNRVAELLKAVVLIAQEIERLES